MMTYRLFSACLALTGFALPGMAMAQTTPQDLSVAVSVCLATIDKPTAIAPTYEKYGFAVSDEDEWDDPELYVAQKGGVMVTFRPSANIYCMIDAANMPLSQGQPIGFAATAAAASPMNEALYDGCPARDVQINGQTVRVAAINTGNEVFCDPTRETRFMIEAR